MHSFLQKRFATDTFVGLPLTVIIFSTLLIIATFGGLLELIIESGPIINIDSSFTQFLFVHRTDTLTQFFYTVTQFGSLKVIGLLIPVVVAALFYYKKNDLLLPLVVSLVGSEVVTALIKLAIHRSRPGENIAFYLEKTYSFPSGHATIAMAFYGFIIYFLMRLERQYKVSQILSGILAVLILLIGFSRIYLGVHYLSDVVGGFLIGGLWLLLSISLREILGWRRSLVL